MATKKARKAPAKAGAKRKSSAPAAMRAWEMKYPDFPNLFAGAQLDDCDAIFAKAGQLLGNRVLSGTAAPDSAWELQHAAILYRFAERVHAGEAVEPFILDFLARAFMDVLHGMPWDDAIRLPGRPLPPEWQTMHPKDQRDALLFWAVSARVDAGSKVMEAINAVAADRNASMQTVRSAYYRWKKRDEHGRSASKSETDK